MKILLPLIALLVSMPARADTYSERSGEIRQRENDRFVALVRKSNEDERKKFFALLAGFARKHHLRSVPDCETAGFSYRSQRDGVGTTAMSASGLEISLKYAASDLKQTVINQDTGFFGSVDREPMPYRCSFDLADRDQSGCVASREDAHRPNDLVGSNLVVECISKSLKKSRAVLGPLYQ